MTVERLRPQFIEGREKLAQVNAVGANSFLDRFFEADSTVSTRGQIESLEHQWSSRVVHPCLIDRHRGMKRRKRSLGLERSSDCMRGLKGMTNNGSDSSHTEKHIVSGDDAFDRIPARDKQTACPEAGRSLNGLYG